MLEEIVLQKLIDQSIELNECKKIIASYKSNKSYETLKKELAQLKTDYNILYELYNNMVNEK